MSTIVTRSGKGSPLTNTEVDANFTNLDADKAELSGAAFTGAVTTTSTVDGRDVSVDGAKLDGVAAGAEVNTVDAGDDVSVLVNDAGYLTTAYVLPAATSTALGGVEIFSDTVQSVAANGVTATASKTYGVQLDSSGRAVVNVPWISAGGIALDDLSASVTAVGAANLTYENTSGVFYYTPPDLSSYATASSATAFTNKSGAISQWTNDSGYSTTTGTVTPSSTDTFTNKSGAISQWTNDSAYLTSYTEADTLDSVTGRGAVTTNAVTVGSFTSTGIEDNATSTAITIDSDERVGVNITPTNRTFEVKAIGDAQIVASFETGSGVSGRIAIADANTTADNSVGIGSSGDNLSLYAGAAARATLSSAGDLSVTGNLTSLGIDDNATSTAITIDASENVGIGTNTPRNITNYGIVTLNGTSGSILQLRNGDVDGARVQISPSSMLILTEDTRDIGFKTGGSTDRMIIKGDTGNVGIGTDAPSTALHVKGSSADIRTQVTGDTQDGRISFAQTDGTVNGVIRYSHTDNAMRFMNNNEYTERMRIDSAGLVSIGTTTAASNTALTVQNQGTYQPSILVQSTGASWAAMGVAHDGNSQGNFNLIQDAGSNYIYSSGASTLYHAVLGAGAQIFTTNNTERMRITSAGLVGIGTDTPNTILETNVASGNNEFRQSVGGSTVGQIISSATDQYLVNLGSGTQRFYNGGSPRMSIGYTGIVSGTWSNYTAGNASAKQMKLTQAQYDALTPDANTMYFIVG